jgi:nitrile hydratase subunit beta
MDGIHDLGGMEGFGPVEPEPDEPVFHADWERRAFGLTFATFAMGLSNGGQFRHSIERMDAVHYLTSRYYEHWITAVATRAVETGLVDRDDLEARAGGPFPLSRPVVAPVAVDPRGDGAIVPPRFTAGDRVRVRPIDTRGHTRCPRYVRGQVGTVVRVDITAAVPDIEAHTVDGRAHAEATYSVRFELGDNACVHVDLWDAYLEAAA